MILTLNLETKHFPYPLIVEFVDGKIWKLVEDFQYIRDCGEVITVPKGFLFDFASIPRFCWGWIGSPTGEYGPAALIHDFLCLSPDCPIRKTDRIFLECMTILEVPRWKRLIMFFAVRAFHCFR